MKPTAYTMFAGGGGKSLGAMHAGFDLVGAVEYIPAIAEVYAQNVSPNITVASVCDIDFRPYADIDLGMASPSCKRASIANVNAGESEEDIACAQATARFIRQARPKSFLLENVWGYRNFRAFALILDALLKCEYVYSFDHVNMSHYNVPQSRKRLILRAVQSRYMLPTLPNKATTIPGWFDAVEDLIPTLEDSQFADWQLRRLGDIGASFLVDNQIGPRSGAEKSLSI